MSINKRLIKSNEGGAIPLSFNTVLYTGNQNPGLQITGVGFQPDLVWIKSTQYTQYFTAYDSVRGASHPFYLAFSDTEATINYLSSFDADGFTIGYNGNPVNSPGSYVSYCWKAGGTAAANTDGTITSQVSANVEAGFSVVSYTGNSTAGATIGHGLNSAPSMIILKCRTRAENWIVYNSALGANKYINLNRTNAANTYLFWNNTNPTSSVFSVNNDIDVNNSLHNYVAYCFAETEGFSKIGGYTGAGASNTITTDFEPAFVYIKRTDSAGSWLLVDNKRNTTNPRESFLCTHTNQTPFPITNGIDFNSNNFTINSTNADLNAFGGNYIYMAFANQF